MTIRKYAIYSSIAAVALAVGAGQSYATILFTIGNDPQPNDENILLNTGLSGTTIFGNGNQTGLEVSFSSPESLSAPSNGQARVEAGVGELNDILITVPGGSFTSLIFNAFDGSGIANITAIANEPGGGTQTFTFSYNLSNGQNFSTATTIDGETIQSVRIESADGFADLRQVRVGGIALVPPQSVPDGGSTFSLIGLGVGLMGFLRSRYAARR